MGLLSRALTLFGGTEKSLVEGQYREGPWQVEAGLIPADWPLNYWQQGRNPIPLTTRSAMVEACVAAYSQTVAMCPGTVWRLNAKGGHDRAENHALTRILKRPNSYQSISDFLLNATRSLYVDGNAYALAVRNDRYEISELHLMDPRRSFARIAPETGEIFYALGGNPIIDARLRNQPMEGVPARDVLHIRLHTSASNPLKGETPLEAALPDIVAMGAMTAAQAAFFANRSRPSGILATDLILTPEQTTQLRQSWNEQSRGLNSGGTPILSGGLKWQPVTMTNTDAQVAEVAKLSDQHIALAYRVPLAILGIGGTPFASTEMLMQSWLSGGLTFTLNHIEEAVGNLFGLRGQPEEFLEFDVEILLRSALKDRVESLVKGVQGGIFSPNEARRKEGYPDVEFGDDPRMQQQQVPLSYGAQLQPPMPAPVNPTPPPAEPDGSDDEEQPDGRDLAALLLERAQQYGLEIE